VSTGETTVETHVTARRIVSIAAVLSLAGVTAVASGPAAHAAPTNTFADSVQIGYTDSATPSVAYDRTEGTDLPLGTRVVSGRRHTSRVYATYDLAQFRGSTVSAGTLRIREATAADCSKRAIEVWQTLPVSRTPTWRTAPPQLRKLDEILTPEACPATITFDVTAAVTDALARNRTRVTFALRVPERFEHHPSYGRTLSWFTSVSLSVRHNHAPTIGNEHLYNAGFPCRSDTPVPAGGFAGWLQALGADADAGDPGRSLRYDFAVWPVDDPAARAEYSSPFSFDGRVSTADVPEDALADGRTYAWQVRAFDGVAFSSWSRTCLIAVDRTGPPVPAVTSDNYPESGSGTFTPLGEPGRFRFDAGGNADVVGFEYAFDGIGVPGCEVGAGDVGQLVCPELFTQPGQVRANQPGGVADVLINPGSGFINRLVVRSIDAAGNRSPQTEYEFWAPDSEPSVSFDGTPQWGDTVTVRFAPHEGLTGTTSYEYRLDSGPPTVVAAGADGTATITFVASNEFGHTVYVRSRGGNGFVSTETQRGLSFVPWPGVTSDVYVPTGEPGGGVGVAGPFTFSRPPGTRWLTLQGYRYSFNGADPVTVPAGTDGRATVVLTPAASGWNEVVVWAVDANGSQSDYANFYSFNVA
jgi:hypothetical protein